MDWIKKKKKNQFWLFIALLLQDIFPDKATERKILSYLIKCPSKGCQWTGELRSKMVRLSVVVNNNNSNKCKHKLAGMHISATRGPLTKQCRVYFYVVLSSAYKLLVINDLSYLPAASLAVVYGGVAVYGGAWVRDLSGIC